MPRILCLVVLLLGLPWASAVAQTTYHVSASGSGAACSEPNPCTFPTALTQATGGDGDTIIVAPGTYSGDVTINADANLTITTTQAVKAALIWGCGSTHITDCGIVTGDTDDRPFWSSGSWNIASNGVTIDHLRIRQGASTSQGFCFIVSIGVTGVTVTRSEIWNGCNGIQLIPKGIRLTYNFIHDGGNVSCGGNDHHGIGVYNFGDVSAATSFGSRDTAPTSSTGLVISNNTIRDFEGDGMQELGEADSGIPSQFLLQESNHVFSNCEQGLDYKGTRNVIIRGNDVEANGYGGISTNDSDGAVNYRHLDWWIYDNRIHGHSNYGLFSQQGDDGRWMIWNNLFYENCQNPEFNWSALNQPPPNSLVEHNVFYNNNRSGGNACGGLVAERGASVLVRNNIFYNNGTGSTGNIGTGGNATISNNRCFPVSPGICGSDAETSSANDFVDSAASPPNLRLVAGVQSIDAGTLLTANDEHHTILIDADGRTRPFGGAVDHGAYEFGGVVGGDPPGPFTITSVSELKVAGVMGYRDSTTASGASTTPTVAAPTVVENDIILWVISVDDVAVTISAYPTGFTQLGIARPSGDGHTLGVAWKRATASEPGTYTGTITNGVADHIVQAITLSGRHLTDPPTISASAVNNAANASPVSVTANGVTALDGDDLVWISGPDVRAINIGNGHTPPASYTEREDAENAWTNLGIATRDNVSAGATGTVTGTFTLSSGQAGWAAFLVRIPAAATATRSGSLGLLGVGR